jgi:acyl transferase domain-containing protein
MTWEEAKSRCPPGVYPACHNSQQMVTVSGPADDVSKFVTQLQSEDIFARQVNSSGVAFHSVYVKQAVDSSKTELLKVANDTNNNNNNNNNLYLQSKALAAKVNMFTQLESNISTRLTNSSGKKHKTSNSILKCIK